MRLSATTTVTTAILMVTGLILIGSCDSPETIAPVTDDRAVIYVAHDRLFSDPILADFQGPPVEVVGDTEASKTTGLVQRIIRLAARPEADVFWNNEILRTVQLAEMGLLQPYVPSSAAGIPAQYSDPAGRWVGFAARARVILYNTDRVAESEVPRSILQLTEPRYKNRVVMANPLFGTTATHMAVLRQELGLQRFRDFLELLRANGVRIVAGNAMARNLVMNGEVAICLTDTDDANGAFLLGKPVAMVYPDQDGMGALVIPNTVALVKGAPHPGSGRRLIDYIASREVEERLVKSRAAQLPLRSGIAPHSARFDPATIHAMSVDWVVVARRFVESTDLARRVLLD